MYRIKEDRVLQHFLDLVAIDSESYHEADLAAYIKEVLKKMEIDYYEDEASEELRKICQRTMGKEGRPANNLYVCLPGNLPEAHKNQEQALLLSAHMDTVHPGNHKLALVHEDGSITSDGTTVLGADDLAGIAEMLELLHICKETDLPHPDLEFLFTAAEEPFCQGSRLVEYYRIKARMALVLDLGGSIGRAAYQAPGIYSIYVHVHGKASHAGSAPEKGIHALFIAAKALTSLPYGKVDEETTINFGTIHGGTDKNVVPEDVYLTGEMRSMDTKKAEDWAEEIQRVFKSCAEELGGEVSVRVEKEFDAYCVSQESLVNQTYCQSCEALGIKPELIVTYGGSDGNNFNAHGIESLVIANGMNQIHSLSEYSSVEDLVKTSRLLVEFLLHLSNL